MTRIAMDHGTMNRVVDVLKRLALIANAYDDNDLDDEARKRWGKDLEHLNDRPASDITLYSGRGGKELLTLQDCFDARAVMHQIAPGLMPAPRTERQPVIRAGRASDA